MEAVRFKPGIWGFSWDDALQETGKQGVLFFSNEELKLDIPIGSLLGDPFVFCAGRSNLPERAEKLYGFTQDGQCVVLHDAWSCGTGASIPGMEHQSIRARCLFARKGAESFDIDKPVESITLSLRRLREWAGETVFSMKLNEQLSFESLEKKDDLQSFNLTLLNDDRFCVAIYHTYTIPSFSVGDLTFGHDCKLEVAFKDGVCWTSAVHTAQRISRFFTLCMGFHAAIETLDLQFADQGKPVHFYQGALEGKEPTKRQLNNMPFPYSRLKNDVERVLGAWLRASKQLSDVQDMLVSQMVLDWRMPVSTQMTASSQLLEALSKYDADLFSMPIDRHGEQMRMLEDALAGVDKDLRKHVLSLFRRNRKGQTRLLEELLQRHKEYVNWLMPSSKRFLNVQVAARNAVNHQDSDYTIAPHELHDHVQVTLLLAYGMVWSILGLDEVFIIKRIEQSNYNYWVVDKARKMYSDSSSS